MGDIIQRVTYRVHVLTPVHVGSGQRLGGHDIAVINGSLWRIDVDRVAEFLAREPRLLDRYVTQGAQVLAEWPEEKRRACARYALPWSAAPPREVREHIADPLGRFYIPGTTVKGAVRTAILWSYNYGIPEEAKRHQQARIGTVRRRETAGEPWQKHVFGRTPNYDILRGLRVSDSTPAPPSHRAVVEVRVAVQEPNDTLTWFIRPHVHTEDMARATALWAEVIPAGVHVLLDVEVDRFLTENATLTGEEPPARPARALGFERKRRFLQNWQQRCNVMALWLAREERRWAHTIGFQEYEKFYAWLLADMEKHPDAVYLQLGWGVGWRGKTAVEPLGAGAVQAARQAYGLGRPGDPFPKTRRVVFRKGRPYVPLGWVRLDPA